MSDKLKFALEEEEGDEKSELEIVKDQVKKLRKQVNLLEKEKKNLAAENTRLREHPEVQPTALTEIEAQLTQLRTEIDRLKRQVPGVPQIIHQIGSDEMHEKIRELRGDLTRVPPHRRKIVTAIDDYTGKKNNKYTAIGEGYRFVCNQILADKSPAEDQPSA